MNKTRTSMKSWVKKAEKLISQRLQALNLNTYKPCWGCAKPKSLVLIVKFFIHVIQKYCVFSMLRVKNFHSKCCKKLNWFLSRIAQDQYPSHRGAMVMLCKNLYHIELIFFDETTRKLQSQNWEPSTSVRDLKRIQGNGFRITVGSIFELWVVR